MLSVFITPWTKPTRIQCATIRALRSQTSRNQRARSVWLVVATGVTSASLASPMSAPCPGTSAPSSPASSGKSRRMVKSISRSSSGRSSRADGSSKLPKRMNDGATRQTMAPGSCFGLPS